MTSQERTDEKNILTPRSPVFERKPIINVYKNKVKGDISIKNESWGRKDGTPNFNKIATKNNDKYASNMFKINQKEEENEFDISFTNENYNIVSNKTNVKIVKNEELQKSSMFPKEIIINKNEHSKFHGSNKGGKMIQLTENISNNKNYGTKSCSNGSDFVFKNDGFKTKQDPTRKVVRQQFGSPIPTKVSKLKSKLEQKEGFPAFGNQLDNGSLSFPEIPEGPTDSNEFETENIRLEDKLSKKKRSNRILAPNVKILDLQHNLMQVGDFPQMLFEENGQIIDCMSLREELRGLNKHL